MMQVSQQAVNSAVNQIAFLYTALPGSVRPMGTFSAPSKGEQRADVVFGLFNFDVTVDSEMVWTLTNLTTNQVETLSTPIGPLHDEYPDAELATSNNLSSFRASVHLLKDLQPGDYQLEADLQVDHQSKARATTYFTVEENANE